MRVTANGALRWPAEVHSGRGNSEPGRARRPFSRRALVRQLGGAVIGGVFAEHKQWPYPTVYRSAEWDSNPCIIEQHQKAR